MLNRPERNRSVPRRRKGSPYSTTPRMEFLERRELLAGTAITTYHNNNQSTGVNSTETQLTPTSVNVATFGKQFSTQVDGQVYAQPLYVPGANITVGAQQGLHNVVYVATQHNSVYAIDSSGGSVLWQTSLLDVTNPKINRLAATAITTMPAGETGSGDITVEVGITATPVIDLANNVMYVEAKSKQQANGTHYVHTLFKINISSGAILDSKIIGDTKYDGNYTYRTTDTGTGTDPYVIGTGDGAITVGNESRVYFNALRQMERPGLVLWNGHLITAYASHGDNGPYHGWVLMYNASTLALEGVFNTIPNGGLGGIWQSGGITAIDSAGNMYFETGNGTFDSNNGVATTAGGFQGRGNYGDSFLKIAIDSTSTQTNQNGNINGWGLKLVDYFSPFNNAQLDSADTDLGSGGLTLLPDGLGGKNLLVGAGKEGKIYLIDRNNMGKFDPATDHVVQTVGGGINGSLNTPAFFNNRLYYFPGYSGPGRSFDLSGGTIGTYQQTTDNIGYLDGTPSISANGVLNGVVWVIDRGSNQLKAYDANDLTKQLWTSAQAGNNRDQLGSVVKFTVPTVADGQVFVGTADHLVVYGPPIPLTAPPAAPSNVQLSATAFNRVVVSWTDNSNNEDSFLVERSRDNVNWGLVGTVGTNGTSYVDTTTTATTSYYYRVRSHNTYNTDSYSPFASAGPVITPQAPPTGTGDGLLAKYYLYAGAGGGTQHLNGTPLLTRNDVTADFDWGNGSPDAAVPADGFSVRWTGTVTPTVTQAYTFSTSSDDGIRLWVNNQIVIDNWTDHGPTVNTATVSLTAGLAASIRMEFYENGGGALARLHWSSSTFADTAVVFDGAGATAQFYRDSTSDGWLQGSPVLTRVEGTVDSGTNWDGSGSPGPTVGNTNFSTSWTGKVQAQYSEQYTFHTNSDDGVRLWVNGQLLIDNWTYHGATDNYGTITLSAGQLYDLRMDFFQGGGGDVAQLSWSSTSTADGIVPRSQLYSGTAPAAPTNLAAHPTSGTEVALTWINNANIGTAYAVERSTDGVNYTVVVNNLPPFSNSYNDTALNPNVTYSYRVRVLNFAENSAYSNVVTLTTPIPPEKPTGATPTVITTNSINFGWNDNANNEDGYRITRSINNGSFIVIATLPPNTTTYSDSGLPSNARVEYHIQAFNVAGFNDFTGFNTNTKSLAPTAPSAGVIGSQVTVAWTGPAGFAGVTYNVYRGTTAGGQGAVLVATGLQTASFTDNGLPPGSYFYKVSAVNAGGESARSAEVSATVVSRLLSLQLQANGSITGLLDGVAITTIAPRTNVTLTQVGANDQVIIRGTSGDDNVSFGNKTFSWLGTTVSFSVAIPTRFYAGDGNDTIRVTANNPALAVSGEVGNDQLVLSNGVGVAAFDGGIGTNTLNYAAYATGVNVNLGTNLATNIGALANVLNVTGGSGNDTITGDELNNLLIGGVGNDTLIGGLGNDTLDGGLGNNVLQGGDGNDTYAFSQLSVAQTDTVIDSSGIDGFTFSRLNAATPLSINLSQGDGVTPLAVTALQSLIYTGSQIENVTGGAGNDTIIGNSLNNSLNGGLGNNVLQGGDGNDTYGFNQLSVAQTDTVIDSSGIDGFTFSRLDASTPLSINLSLGNGVNPQAVTALQSLIYTGSQIENVTGGAGNDTIIGNSLNNYIDGGLGNNLLQGGDGNDTYAFSQLSVAQTDTVIDSSGIDGFTFSRLNAATPLSINLSQGDGVTPLAVTALQSLIYTGSQIENVTGGAGNDTIIGNSLNNSLNGGLGNNVLQGGDGNDTYGFNQLSVAQTDTVIDSSGIDGFTFSRLDASTPLSINLSLGNGVNPQAVTALQSLIYTGSQIENVTGGAGNDTIIGNSLNNYIDGGLGNNLLQGGDGNDTYAFNQLSVAQTDTVIDSSGSDGFSFSRLNASTPLSINLTQGDGVVPQAVTALQSLIYTGSQIENVTGGAGNDTIIGNSLNNSLNGGAGNDVLVGGGGTDTLVGGTGDDILIGGLGGDRLVGGSGADLLLAGATIYDNAVTALSQLRQRWIASSDYATRVAAVTQNDGTGVFLSTSAGKVLNDASTDNLRGEEQPPTVADGALDLFIGTLKTQRPDQQPGETFLS